MRIALHAAGECQFTGRELGQVALAAWLGVGTPAEVLRHLDLRGIAIRAGDLAALPLLKRFGVPTAARASCYLYTQTSELDRLATAFVN